MGIQKIKQNGYVIQVGKTYNNRCVEYPIDYCINDIIGRLEYFKDIVTVSSRTTMQKIVGGLFCANVLFLNIENNLDEKYDIVNKEILLDISRDIILNFSKILDFRRGIEDVCESKYFVDKNIIAVIEVLINDLIKLIGYKEKKSDSRKG